MKLGTENRTKTTLALALLAIAIISLVWALRAPSPGAGAASPAKKGATAKTAGDRKIRRTTRESKHVAAVLAPTLDPRLRLDLLQESENIHYAGTGRNIFRAEAEPAIPKPVASGLTDKKPTPFVPGPPPPPAIDLKFYGWASKPGEPKKVFLSQGDDLFVAREGDIIARRYKVVRIGPNAVEIRDMLSNSLQTISLNAG